MAQGKQQLAGAKRTRVPMTIDLSTVPNPGVTRGGPPSPVIGVHVIPAGPRYLFDDAAPVSTGKRYIIVGVAADCDLRIQDRSVSAHHCAIVRRQDRVYVNDLGSTNGVWVAGVLVRSCELHAGAVVTIGSTSIAAIGPGDRDAGIVLAASTLPELIRKALDAYGSMRAAAEGIGVPYSTLRGWLEKA